MVLKESLRAACPACRRYSTVTSTSSPASILSLSKCRLPSPAWALGTTRATSRTYATPSSQWLSRRTYATVHDAPNWPTTANPSPYDILNLKRGEPYSKKRFYELVKLYHPDKHDHSPTLAHLPHATRVERYRLVVAAHDLLSDPAKRRLYDTRGEGWAGGRPQSIHEHMRQSDHAWRDAPGNPAHNATWEDWERWRAAQAARAGGQAQPQYPLYMSNGMFAMLVVGLCSVGIVVQMYRAETAGTQYVEHMQNQHGAIARGIQGSTMGRMGRSRDERVDVFLRDRENGLYDYSPEKQMDLPQLNAPQDGWSGGRG